MILDYNKQKLIQELEKERIRRKSLIDSWMEGAFSSSELHRVLSEERAP